MTCALAVRTRLELATSCVTGRHSNQAELPDQPVKALTAAKVQPFLILASVFFDFFQNILYFIDIQLIK